MWYTEAVDYCAEVYAVVQKHKLCPAELSRAQARNLRKAAADIDIWRGGLERVFGRNEFNFYHPLYFLHYLDKAGLLEFNPYEKFKKIKPRHPHSSAAKSKFAEHYNSPIKVLSNPGFAPAVNTNSDSVRFPYSHSGLFYGAVNWCYQCSIYADPDMVGKQHTGVDFAGYEGTPIYSFIQGKVWATTYMGNTNNGISNGGKSYGRLMLIKGNNNFLYLLAHLSRYNKVVGDSVMPGDVVAYVGNTGGSDGAHLHLEVFECENSIEKKKVINVEADENIEMKWRDNVRWNRNKRVDPFNHDEHGGKG